MKPATWIILQDFESSGRELPQYNPQSGRASGLNRVAKNVSIWGPRDTSKPVIASLPLEFIIADDDGNVYYRGSAESMTFAPLDMYGEPNAGATTIAYWENGQWRAL